QIGRPENAFPEPKSEHSDVVPSSLRRFPLVNRDAHLEADSLAVGDAWVEHVKRALAADNRVASGGWPGTMREARARTYAHFTNHAALQRHGALSHDELEQAVRAVYDRARNRWLACARTDGE